MSKKHLFLSIFVAIILLGAFILAPTGKNQAGAQENENVLRGYAWSSHIGWISFQAEDKSQVMKNDLGFLDGYAWSPNVGWIKFHSSLTGPVGCSHDCYGAKMVGDGGVGTEIKGWARACSVFVSNCSGSLRSVGELGGWDGWIEMNGPADGHGISIVEDENNQKRFDGFAWGNLNLGWITFGLKSAYGGDVIPPGGGSGVACSVSPATGQVGESFTWQVDLDSLSGSGLTGDMDSYNFVWHGDGDNNSEIEGQEGEIVTTIYDSEGVRNAFVEVYNSTSGELLATSDLCSNNTNGDDGTGVVVGDGKYTLTVNVIGNGSVSDDGGKIPSCVDNDGSSNDCQAEYPFNEEVTLTSSAEAKWTGECMEGDSFNGTSCNLTMNNDKTVTVCFGTSEECNGALRIEIIDGEAEAFPTRMLVVNPTYPAESTRVNLRISGGQPPYSVSADFINSLLTSDGVGFSCDGGCSNFSNNNEVYMTFESRQPDSSTGLSKFNGLWTIPINVTDSAESSASAPAQLKYVDPVQQSG